VATPASVTSYLTALGDGDLAAALANADDTGEAPAGANSAENVYRYMATGSFKLSGWQTAAATEAGDGGLWVFVVCQITTGDGVNHEVPLTFHTNRAGKLVFVG
jgi:hypothetical protein